MAINIADIIGGSIGDTADKIIGAFKENPTVKAQLQSVVDANAAAYKLRALEIAAEIQKEVNEQVAAQIAVNEADARGNWFQSSWRPLIGYICGAGLGYQLLVRPLINFVAQLCHSAAIAQDLDMGTLMTLLMGMLGLGAMRMNEKLNDKD